jgi:hypothetical protein
MDRAVPHLQRRVGRGFWSLVARIVVALAATRIAGSARVALDGGWTIEVHARKSRCPENPGAGKHSHVGWTKHFLRYIGRFA